jgi:hypothetical protein
VARSQEYSPQSATMSLSTFPGYTSSVSTTHGRTACIPKSCTSRRYRNAASNMVLIVSARKITQTCPRSCQVSALMLEPRTYKCLHPHAVSAQRTRRERALATSVHARLTA